MNWDLTLIYKTKEDYLKDFNSLDEDVLKIEALKGKLNTEELPCEFIIKSIKVYSEEL